MASVSDPSVEDCSRLEVSGPGIYDNIRANVVQEGL